MGASSMTPRRRPHETRTVLHGEALEAALREMEQFTTAEAERIKARHPERQHTPDPSTKPDISSLLDTSLRAVLEDEIAPAVRTPKSGQILPHELHRELMKKALAALKADALKVIAKRHSVETSGGLEALTMRVAELYHWDEEKIAQLILEHEDEPSEERGHLDRIFPLEAAPDLDYVADRLHYVLGRYIRTGIAKWFVFEHIDLTADEILLRGTLRSYKATVSEAAAPSVIAVPAVDHSVDLVIDGSEVVRVRRANAAEGSAAVGALRTAAKIEPLGYVQPKTAGVTGTAVSFADTSLFMLDLLANRFAQAGLQDRNLTVARFRLADRAAPTSDEAPHLRAVRFEGTHLLDSATACKLLADDGRSLVDISFTTRTPPRPDGERGQLPVRVAVERDHVVVFTGFGVVPALSFGVHQMVIEAVIAELLEGLADAARVEALAERVRDRATQVSPVEQADMLADTASPNGVDQDES